MPPRKLREPSMPPSMEKVKGQKLRTGWTTGTCAAAAAKAAASALASGRLQTRVDVKLPGKGRERRVEFDVERCDLGGSWAEAVVIKDAGDDPDVTDGAHLTARVSWLEQQGLELDRGDGVGSVTKPGLGLPVGGPAINAVPRRMISTP
jgi:cobalt-precorrin-5B (C1)-methyltransferase